MWRVYTHPGMWRNVNITQGSWSILFSHPADYTPVCTTELGRAQAVSGEFAKRGVKMIALSCDSVEDHNGWINDIKSYNGLTEFSYPIIADPSRWETVTVSNCLKYSSRYRDMAHCDLLERWPRNTGCWTQWPRTTQGSPWPAGKELSHLFILY